MGIVGLEMKGLRGTWYSREVLHIAICDRHTSWTNTA
jgi:hypothetical protein